MVTLALDLAGQTGVAILYDTGQIELDTWRLAEGDLGGARSPLPMLRLWDMLCEFGAINDISKIVLEETFGRGAAKYRLDSLQHTAILYAMIHKIVFLRLSPNQWKAAVVGNGRASKQEYFNYSLHRWPEHSFANDDEAAARCLLQYAIDLPSCMEE